MVGRNAEHLASISNDLLVRGAQCAKEIVADLSEIKTHQGLIELAVQQLGGLDAVLIAHGTLGSQAASETDVELMLNEMMTNALSYMSLLTILANLLAEQRSGCIAVITSVAGDRGRRSNYVYGSAKAAVTAFTSGLRARLHASGVAVVTIKPGLVDTPMTSGLKKGPLFASSENVGHRIYEAMLRGDDVVYTPWFWAPIMQLIRWLPEPLFKRAAL